MASRRHNEHIIPISLKGKSEFENLAKSCGYCKSKKGIHVSTLDPVSNEVVPLFHPRKQKWDEHFQWSEGGLTIEGRTPTGRATVALLDINSPETVNLRALLPKSEHPPK